MRRTPVVIFFCNYIFQKCNIDKLSFKFCTTLCFLDCIQNHLSYTAKRERVGAEANFEDEFYRKEYPEISFRRFVIPQFFKKSTLLIFRLSFLYIMIHFWSQDLFFCQVGFFSKKCHIWRFSGTALVRYWCIYGLVLISQSWNF